MTRVLAVEDSPTQAALLAADLESAGFEVLEASNGSEALQVLEAEEVDLVLSDVVMPGMDGYELCRRVKDRPVGRDVPVVLLTALTDPLDVVRGLEAGADNFIRKPYDSGRLPERLNDLLQGRRDRSAGADETGLRLSFLNRDFDISSDSQQVLDLLVSTFEELVVTSRAVRAREEELTKAHADLEQQLHRVDLERDRLGAVVASVPVALFVTGQDGRISHASESLAELFGAEPDVVRRGGLEQLADFVDVDGRPIRPESLPHRRALREGVSASAGWGFDVCLVRPDGGRPPVMFHSSPIIADGGRTTGCVGTLQILGPLATYDSVTGLPNRLAFLDRAASILPMHRDQSAVLLVELDRGDALRASLGHAALSELLVELSRRLRETFQPLAGTEGTSECFLAYLGGEQFGVILVDLPDALSVLRLAETCRRAISSLTTGHPLGVTGSVGVSMGTTDLEVPQLMAAARTALQRAHSGGGDTVALLGPDASQEEMDRLHLENDLRTALDRGDIQIAYQPEVDLVTGHLVGFEALARWRHHDRGWVSPATFVGLAEESGLILELGRQVLERACVEAHRWPDQADGSVLTISVNVSAVQLREELVDEVAVVVERTGLDPSRLLLEVTETAAMADPVVTIPVVDRLRERGVRFSLDDFGTGYSSMSLLTRIRFDQLKLDRSFVVGMGEGGPGAIVAQSIVALGRSLGVPVLAEGVETPEQAEALKALGCDQAQGYLFARPMAGTEVVRFLEEAGAGAS